MTTRDYCLNLNDAQPGRWVKVVNSRRGLQGVACIATVQKSGNIRLGGSNDLYKPDPDGQRASRKGEKGYRSTGYNYIAVFSPDESVDGVERSLERQKEEAAARRKAEEQTQELETQGKIALARVEHSNGRDIPGSKVARWIDRHGNWRTTVYFAKTQEMYGGVGYYVNLADFEAGSFSSSYATSMVSPEDAVNRWIAAVYGPLPEAV